MNPFTTTSYLSGTTWQSIGMWGILAAVAVSAVAEYCADDANKPSKAVPGQNSYSVELLTEIYRKAYANEVRHYTDLVTSQRGRGLFTPTALSQEELQEYCNTKVEKCTRLGNGIAKCLYRAMFQIEGVTIWLCQKSTPLAGWEGELGIASPMDLWADTNWEGFKLFHMPDSPIFKRPEDLTDADVSLLNDRAEEMVGFADALTEECVQWGNSMAVSTWLRSKSLNTTCFKSMKCGINSRFVLTDKSLPQTFLLDSSLRATAEGRMSVIREKFYKSSPNGWMDYVSLFLGKLAHLSSEDRASIQKVVDAFCNFGIFSA